LPLRLGQKTLQKTLAERQRDRGKKSKGAIYFKNWFKKFEVLKKKLDKNFKNL
jgi:hypothetical protein